MMNTAFKKINYNSSKHSWIVNLGIWILAEFCNNVIILVKSSHFSFLAKKRGKFQIPREECEEIAKEKN